MNVKEKKMFRKSKLSTIGLFVITVTAIAVILAFMACESDNSEGQSSYIVEYDANGGNGTMENSNHVIGTPKNLNANTFTCKGYTFAGWATFPNGPVEYMDRQSVIDLTSMSGSKITLFAVWSIVTIVPGSNIAEKLAWLQENAQSDVDYTVEVNSDESINPTNLSYAGKNNVGICFISTDVEHIIGLSSSGNLFTVGSGVTLILDKNIILKGRSSDNYSRVLVNIGGALVMNTGSCITDSGGVSIASNGTLTMNGGKISGNTAEYGGGVYVYGTFIMNSGEISGNIASPGGGVYVDGGTFTMNDGKISENNSSYGGGVYVYSGTFTMNGGKISDNIGSTNYSRGGGVYVNYNGTFTINNGEISGNTAYSGGGVYVQADDRLNRDLFVMNGGKIFGNTASGNSGGGVYVGGTFTMNNGEIFGNTISAYEVYGCGVHVGGSFAETSFTMNGGKIYGNTASGGFVFGGGVFVTYSDTFTMNGGEISGNTAYSGGGVYARGTFLLTGGTIYGANESENISNIASQEGSAFRGTAKYGNFTGSTWNSNGSLNTTNDTVRAINGILQ
jgi:hypothetical protein